VLMCNELGSVTYAEKWYFFKRFNVYVGRSFVPYRTRTPGKYYTFYIGCDGGYFVVWMNFTIDIQFPDAPGY
jgi:hypothetical protein